MTTIKAIPVINMTETTRVRVRFAPLSCGLMIWRGFRLVRSLAVLALALIAVACGSVVEAPEPAPFVFSHEVSGLSCGVLYSTDARVAFRCDDERAPLVESCDMGPSSVAYVYAIPGAGDGYPFGVSSHVELDRTGCDESEIAQ